MKNIVYNCDCMDFMENCKDGEFNLAIPDPPQGIKRFKRMHSSDRVHNIKRDKNKSWNNNKPNSQYFEKLFRISKYQIIWGMNNFTLPETEYYIIWDKRQKCPSFAEAELAYTNIKKPAKIFKKYVDVSGKKIHPAEKPVALYKWLLKNYAKPGWTIFDSHVGSGSLRIACYDMGFDFVGCELDPDYWKAQEERFNNHIATGELWEKTEIQKSIYKQASLD